MHLLLVHNPVNDLLQSVGTKAFTPTNESKSRPSTKSYGSIVIDDCRITGLEISSWATVHPAMSALAYADDMTFGGLPVPIPPPRRPTFVEYVSGNCDLSMVRTFYQVWHTIISFYDTDEVFILRPVRGDRLYGK